MHNKIKMYFLYNKFQLKKSKVSIFLIFKTMYNIKQLNKVVNYFSDL